MATQDLGFNVFALDKASRTFIRLADRIEKVSDRLDELDRKRANPQINLDVDERKVRDAVGAVADAADDEGRRRSGGFFRSMFTPNRQVLMALRTGVPAALSSPIGLAGLALGGVFAASFAGAVISSGVFAAVGGGFAALAAVALKENERLKQSFEDLAQTVQVDLTQAANPLVPTFDKALRQIRMMFGPEIRDPLEEIFTALGPSIVPAVESAVRTVGNVLDRLATPEFLSGMQTVLDEISDELPRLGDALGDAFVMIAENGDDIAEAFGHVVTVTSGLINLAARLANAFTDAFNLIAPPIEATVSAIDRFAESDVGRAIGFVSEKLNEALSPIEHVKRGFEFLRESGDEASGMTGKFAAEIQGLNNRAVQAAQEGLAEMVRAEEQLATAMKTTNEQIDHEQDKLDRLKDTMFAAAEGVLGLRESTRSYEEALDAARETLEENGRSLDVNTEKGRANQDAIDDIAASALDHIEAMIEQGKSTEQVSKFTQQAREDFIKAARAAGLEKDEAKALADQLGLVPSEVETKIKAIDQMSGTINSLKRQLRELQRQAGVIPIGTSTGAFFGSSLIRPQDFHSGGKIGHAIPRAHAGLKLGADERLVIGLTGERILNRQETAAYEAGRAMAGGGAASFTVINHGVIGSQRETEDWLTRSLDNLKRKGRLPVVV